MLVIFKNTCDIYSLYASIRHLKKPTVSLIMIRECNPKPQHAKKLFQSYIPSEITAYLEYDSV